jgi:acyl-CoA synthetase (NDP forming)
MQRGKHSSDGGSAQSAAASPALDALGRSVKSASFPDEFCLELSKMFQVLSTEVALFRVEDGQLKFLYPVALRTAGSIPLSSSAVAAHTAVGQKAELYNNFPRIKHASIFEHVKLTHKDEDSVERPIQKLMSAPVFDAKGHVLGVIQISRKGYDLISSGPDFTLEQLQHLERAASLAARAPFMQTHFKSPTK